MGCRVPSRLCGLPAKTLRRCGPHFYKATFFALGYEHSIVNMFVVPAGMMLGADVSLADWWLWNQVPVTLGNVLGSALLTGLALYGAHRPVRPPGAGT
jgi:formate/nitrite transporter FocA (FNT family)